MKPGGREPGEPQPAAGSVFFFKLSRNGLGLEGLDALNQLGRRHVVLEGGQPAEGKLKLVALTQGIADGAIEPQEAFEGPFGLGNQ